MNEPEITEAEATAGEEAEALSPLYVLKHPVQFGTETIESVELKPNGRAMQGVKLETTGEGGLVVDLYRFAQLGIRIAGRPTPIVDKMHPADIFGLGMRTFGFFCGGPGTGKKPSP